MTQAKRITRYRFMLLLWMGLWLFCLQCSEETSPFDADNDADADPVWDTPAENDTEPDLDETPYEREDDSFEETEEYSDVTENPDVEENLDVTDESENDEAEEIPGEIEEEDTSDEVEVEEEIEVEWDVTPLPPAAGEVVFSELMPFPLALNRNEGQWVELTNLARHPITLQGCTVASSVHEAQISEELRIDPLGRIVIGVERSVEYENDVELDWTWGDFTLKLEWDSLRLSCEETLVDTVTYSETNMGMYVFFGASISLCPGAFNDVENDFYANWRLSRERMPNGDRGTPGSANETCDFIGGDEDLEVEWDTEFDALEDVEVDTASCFPASGSLDLPNCGHEIQLPGGMGHETCVIVPQGQCHTYWMGNIPDNWYYVDERELPRHMVHLTQYALSRFPVTVEEYRACIDAGTCSRPVDRLCHIDGSYQVGDPNIDDVLRGNHPVNCVNRYQALDFCRWAGGTLPSEAQWEYGAVGPMATEEDLFNFPWGEDRNECRANIWGSDPFEETSPVGFFDGQLKTRAQGGWLFGPDSFQTCDDSSPFGLKDMTHNVSELVLDFPSSYSDWPEESVNPVWWPPLASGYLSRGSNWVYTEMHHARSHLRSPFKVIPSTLSSIGCGFRCAFEAQE